MTKSPTDRSVFPGSLLSSSELSLSGPSSSGTGASFSSELLTMIFFLDAFFFSFPFSLIVCFSLPVSFVFLNGPFRLPASREYRSVWLSSHAFVWFVFWEDIWEVVRFQEETHIQVGWNHMAHWSKLGRHIHV